MDSEGGAAAEQAERDRLAALDVLGLLDAPPDDELQAVVRVAAAVAGVPFGTLNLIDADRQCQLTTTGFEGGDSPREKSMCALHFRDGAVVHVPDASLDPRYWRSAWVDGRLGVVRLYASVPLVTAEGHALGSLCVFDTSPGELAPDQLARLADLGSVLLALFERRRRARVAAELAAQLEERTELAEAVLSTIDVAVVAAGPDGRLTLFNRAAREWHGEDADPSADPSEHAGRYDLFEGDGTTPMVRERVPLHRALAEGAVTGEEMVIAADGRPPRDVVASGRSMSRADGTPLGAVVTMTDVTEVRARTRALEDLHAELAERSRELERSNSDLARFAAVASHDLRSPMTVVDGYLELLEEELQDGPELALGWVVTARRSARRMLHLTSSLLDDAALDAAVRERALTDVEELAREAVSDLVAGTGADVRVEPLPHVACDAVAVRQLLQNLVGNALHHGSARADGGAPRVLVAAEHTGGQWVFSVADDGPGVPAQDRERVFEPFTALGAGGGRGHGLGLATCRRVVDRHGGRIWMDETPGGGATVRFTLEASSSS
ncbi:GAF domain-containing protein [Streptomyces sp. NP160]|uniref:sensor histidine kinase n=1 Tax=Streptomyces sp. NP160 TaxID=2586637 RepID=UPI00111A9015|nr:ATP-binding protein [Streptomyces sp. NP160]TNM64307.1 GAF domain-containing protein [Streptomyces sp. NP160]